MVSTSFMNPEWHSKNNIYIPLSIQLKNKFLCSNITYICILVFTVGDKEHFAMLTHSVKKQREFGFFHNILFKVFNSALLQRTLQNKRSFTYSGASYNLWLTILCCGWLIPWIISEAKPWTTLQIDIFRAYLNMYMINCTSNICMHSGISHQHIALLYTVLFLLRKISLVMNQETIYS